MTHPPTERTPMDPKPTPLTQAQQAERRTLARAKAMIKISEGLAELRDVFAAENAPHRDPEREVNIYLRGTFPSIFLES